MDLSAGEFPAENSRDIKAIRSQIRAAQFLSKATFGPTQEMIDALGGRIQEVGYRRACSEWIDDQMSKQPSLHEELAVEMFTGDGRVSNTQGVGMSNYRYQAWTNIAPHARRPTASANRLCVVTDLCDWRYGNGVQQRQRQPA